MLSSSVLLWDIYIIRCGSVLHHHCLITLALSISHTQHILTRTHTFFVALEQLLVSPHFQDFPTPHYWQLKLHRKPDSLCHISYCWLDHVGCFVNCQVNWLNFKWMCFIRNARVRPSEEVFHTEHKATQVSVSVCYILITCVKVMTVELCWVFFCTYDCGHDDVESSAPTCWPTGDSSATK